MSDPRQQIERLREQIEQHDHRYYVLADPQISDREYDRLFRQLRDLEAAHPELITPESPTQRVADALTEGFPTIRHPVPLRSLDNSYEPEDLLEFDRRVVKGLGAESPEYVCELKFDGVSVLLHYEHGRFARGATRGDGEQGDDITSNLRTIRALPLRLRADKSAQLPERFYVRGEVYMNKEDFVRFNEEREAEGESTFANPRNTVAGSLKMLDSSIVATRPLSIVCYGLESSDAGDLNHADGLDLLRQLGLPTSPHRQTVKSADAVLKFWKDWEEKRDTLPYEIDGIVVKVNSRRQQQQLGMTARAPRWAMACKFSARRARTTLKDILLQIGRTGALTPVAELEPVPLGGITIRRATLHNFDEIQRLDLRVGDTVVLERGGDVIPKVVEVDHESRKSGARRYQIPKKCPFCGTPVEKIEGEVAIRCPNPRDREVIKRQIEHFASRGALDIDGLGSETVEQLVDEGLLDDAGDLFRLTLDQLIALERFAKKSAQRLLDGLETAKSRPLDRLIFALGIRHVGQSTARSLAVRFGSIPTLASATESELTEISDVGPNVAQAVVDYFASDFAKKLIRKLDRAGFRLESDEVRPRGDRLKGMTFVITGTLSGMTRDEAERAILALGGRVTSSVSKKTTYVIVGESPGSKADKAAKLGVTTIGESELQDLLEGS